MCNGALDAKGQFEEVSVLVERGDREGPRGASVLHSANERHQGRVFCYGGHYGFSLLLGSCPPPSIFKVNAHVLPASLDTYCAAYLLQSLIFLRRQVLYK